MLENLEDLSIEDVLQQFDVTREQIAAVLEFVAQEIALVVDAAGPASYAEVQIPFG